MEREMLDFTLDIAKKAGAIILDASGKPKRMKSKGGHDYVTDTDFASEKAIISAIRNAYPGHGIISEEAGVTRGFDESEWQWFIDPLDGTNNFAYGIPVFGVSIAVYRKRAPVLGVIGLPVLGETFHAVKNGGAFRNGKPVKVSGRVIEDALFLTDDLHSGKDVFFRTISAIRSRVSRMRMFGAAVMHFTRIAAGSADVWIEHGTKPWDIAAGCLIVEEAGGKVTDLAGKAWSPFMKDMAVSNGRFHGELIRILRGVRMKDAKAIS